GRVIEIDLIGDTGTEDNKVFTVQLFNSAGAVLGAASSSTVTISDGIATPDPVGGGNNGGNTGGDSSSGGGGGPVNPVFLLLIVLHWITSRSGMKNSRHRNHLA
ncbi:MAG: hypothetical protein MJA83_18495, partial [Gammaproteobacteria bacterium]|nr:hypothetical protein [Gammaproteobacteria bacterium]